MGAFHAREVFDVTTVTPGSNSADVLTIRIFTALYPVNFNRYTRCCVTDMEWTKLFGALCLDFNI